MTNCDNFATIITDSNLILYYTHFKVEDGFLIIYQGKKYLYTDMRYYHSAVKLNDCKTILISDNAICDFILDSGVKCVGIYAGLTSYAFFLKIKATGVDVIDVTRDIQLVTSVKREDEIAKIKSSCNVIEKALEKSFLSIKEGISERELSAIIEYNIKYFGGEGTSFDTIVAFGEGTAIPHYKTGDNKLTLNTPVLIDCGAYLNGYASDITRSFYYGKPTKKYLEVFNLVYKAHMHAISNIRVGMTGNMADALARSVITDAGYGEYFTHSLGHGVGVQIHESPRLSPKSNDYIKNGNVFSIEPGIYLPGEFGVRIEDTVYVDGGVVKSAFNLSKGVAEFTVPRKK